MTDTTTRSNTITDSSTSVRSILHDFVHHIWELVRLGERRPNTIRAYASMTGIVPPGVRLRPYPETSERNWGGLWERDVRDLLPVELRHWMLDLAEAVRESSPLADAGRVTANRCLKLLDSAIKHAIAMRVLPADARATALVERFTERPRTRYLEPEEVGALWRALLHVEERRAASVQPERRSFARSAPRALRLIALTAMRLREATTLRVDSVHLQRRIIKLTDSKTGYGEVPLCQAAVDLLHDQLPHACDGWVFPSIYGGPIASVYELWDDVVRLADIPPDGVVIHTMRHTVASLLKRADTPLEHIQKILRHRDPATTERAYVHVTVTPGVLAATDKYQDLIGFRRGACSS